MKWDDDEYRELKLEIFDLIRRELSLEHAAKLTIRDASKAIDDFFINLTGGSTNLT